MRIGLGYTARYSNLTSKLQRLFTTTRGLFKVGSRGNLDDGGTDETLLSDWITATWKGHGRILSAADPVFMS
jgi:hypothetical protein